MASKASTSDTLVHRYLRSRPTSNSVNLASSPSLSPQHAPSSPHSTSQTTSTLYHRDRTIEFLKSISQERVTVIASLEEQKAQQIRQIETLRASKQNNKTKSQLEAEENQLHKLSLTLAKYSQNDFPLSLQSQQQIKLSPFMETALHLKQGILQMYKFMLNNKNDYLRISRHLSSSNSSTSSSAMSDNDRDMLEQEVQRFVITFKKRIDQLDQTTKDREQKESEEILQELDEADPSDETANEELLEKYSLKQQQIRSCRDSIIANLSDLLQNCLKMMQEWKQTRTQQMQEDVDRMKHDVSSSTVHSLESNSSDSKEIQNQSDEKEENKTKINKLANLGNKLKASLLSGASSTLNPSSGTSTEPTPEKVVSEDVFQQYNKPAPKIELSEQEQAQLMEENAHLLDQLEDNLDQIRRAEAKMAEIASLMSLFNTKVLEQEEQISTIYDQTVSSTVHVHAGIKELKKASERGVNFRLMVLLTILVLSFSILFLDWYIP